MLIPGAGCVPAGALVDAEPACAANRGDQPSSAERMMCMACDQSSGVAVWPHWSRQ
jgi:hypothetical protein